MKSYVNKGICPPYETVDILLRNGWTCRDVDPKQFRWAERATGPDAGDIVRFMITGKRREE